MNNFEKDEQIARIFPKKWTMRRNGKKTISSAVCELAFFAQNLRENLVLASNDCFATESQKKCFLDYIDLLDKLYDDFLNCVCKKEILMAQKEEFIKNHDENDWKAYAKFHGDFLKKMIDEKKFEFDEETHSYCGVKKEYYKEISSIAKKIFILEKLAESESKKIWKKLFTDPQKLDLNKQYCIIAKIVYEEPWRWNEENPTAKKLEYDRKRIYQSASILTDEDHSRLFLYQKDDIAAVLVYAPETSKIVCMSSKDCFSDEWIDGKNHYENKTIYSKIFRLDTAEVQAENHEVFSNASKVASPDHFLSDIIQNYNEVIMRSPTVVGVIAPNEESVDYARCLAFDLGVRYFGNFEREMDLDEEL